MKNILRKISLASAFFAALAVIIAPAASAQVYYGGGSMSDTTANSSSGSVYYGNGSINGGTTSPSNSVYYGNGSMNNTSTTYSSPSTGGVYATYTKQSDGRYYVELFGKVYTGGTATDYWFEYGINSSNLNQTIGNGSTSYNGASVTTSISNVNQGTIIYYALKTKNSISSNSSGILSVTIPSNSSSNTNTNNNNGGGNITASAPTVSTASAVTSIGSYYGMAPDANTESATFYGDKVYLNGSVYPRSYSVDVWFAYGTDSNWLPSIAGYRTITNGNYWMGVSEPITLQPGTTYYYRVVARSAFGTQSGNIMSFTMSGNGAVNINLKPTISSVYATNVLRNSAIMRGQINPNGSATTFWFEYGTTPSPFTWTLKGERTSVGALNGYSNVSMAVTGLDTATTYYYRVVAQNAYGTSASDVAQLTTKTWLASIVNNNETTPIVVKGNDNSSVVGGNDISLDPSVSKTEVVSGDNINFTVSYKNSGKSKLSGATIKMTLPDSVEYVGASTALTSRAGNALSFYVGDILSGTQGNIIVNVKVKSGVKSGDTLMFSTMMEYYDSLKKFQSISSYVTSNVKVQADNQNDNSNLAGSLGLASIFTSGGLNIILIILVIVTLGYLITSRRKQQ